MRGTFSLPLFPLDVVLVPGERLPLHIFEERYRLMIRYCLETEEPFGVVYEPEDGEMATVGCSAQIQQVIEEYEDGRLDILTRGENRFRITQIYHQRAYMTADVEPVEEHREHVRSEVRERVITQHMKLMELAGETIRPNIYEGRPRVSFVLAHNAGLSLEQKQRLLEMNSENERLEYLVSHLADLIPRLSEYQDTRWQVRSDGHFGDELPDLEI
jgi:ATP-dependent Lon protease